MPWERQEEVVGAPWSIWTEPGETRRTWAVGDTEWERAKTVSTGRREVCSASTAGSLRSKRLSVTLAGSTGLSSLHQVKELPQLLETQRLHLHSVRVKQHWMRTYCVFSIRGQGWGCPCPPSAQDLGTSQSPQWLRLHPSTTGGEGSIPGPETRMPRGMAKK